MKFFHTSFEKGTWILKCLFMSWLFFLGYLSSSYGQEIKKQDSSELPKTDLFDVIRKWMKKPALDIQDTIHTPVKNLSLLPIIGYSPANGFVIGAAISITRFLGIPSNTKLSTALINVSFTTKDQTLLNLRFDLSLAENKWRIAGDNRLLLFSQSTYGLGIYGLDNQTYHFNFNGFDVQRDSTTQPMTFNYIRAYDLVYRKISNNNWYAGAGIMIDYHYDIKDISLRLDSPTYLTSHYIYSKNYGFDTAKYSTNGLALQVLHDSRDNPINPYSGNYLSLGYRVNPTFFGSNQNSTMLYYEFRTYFGVKKSVPRDVLAFWFLGTSVLSGNVPYLALPALTWDSYNRAGRGYIQGRFRGNNLLYGEAEYRFRLSKSGLFGGVVFANATTASNSLSSQPVFAAVAPGAGFGLRIKMNKADRTNICVDYGMGKGFSGIYFNIREAF